MDFLNRLLALLKLPLALLAALRSLYADYATLLAGANTPPGIPVPNPTCAFWQDNPPYPELTTIHSAAGPPHTADIVIIGSGIAGAAIARSVLHELHRKGELYPNDLDNDIKHLHDDKRRSWVRVLVLEAREICSGATGRNGGHIKASPQETFHRLVHNTGLSRERAAKLCAFQLSHVQMLKEVVEAEGIADISQFREVTTLDVSVDPKTQAEMVAQMEEFVPHQPDGFSMRSHSADEARKQFGVSEQAAGALSYPAGAIWPFRFVTALWRVLLDQFPAPSLAIETGTAVTAVECNASATAAAAGFPYALSTTRGQVLARHVVHATNGFASQLVPALRGKATGILCHMTAQRPGDEFPGNKDGKLSWSPIYGQGFSYVTQLPETTDKATGTKTGGELMVGGGYFQSGKQGLDMLGVYDDSRIEPMTLIHLEGLMPTLFNWGADAPGHRRIRKAWSGVVALSADFLPLVGRLDPRITKRKPKTAANTASNTNKVAPGEWIAAYYCGDGMVWAWLCATAVGIMLAGSEDEDLPKAPGRPAGRVSSWFPHELSSSYSRIQKLNIADLASEF